MDALLGSLINAFVVTVPLAAVVWVALRVSRRWVNAATRYAIWWMVLAVVVLLPLRDVPVRAPVRYVPAAAMQTAVAGPAFASPHPVARGVSRQSDAARLPVRIAPGPWAAGIVAVWAIAALAMLLRLIVSYLALGRMKREAAEPPDAVAALAQHALDLLRVTRRVRVGVVKDAVSPMVAGPIRPTILLPAAILESMEDAEIEQICLHEATHLARRDDWALMIQRVIEAIFAPHPLVRWVAGQISLEREIACDDFVISVTGSARPYASCLTRIAELAGGLSGSAAAAAVSNKRSHLTQRVEMLLDKTRHAGTRLMGLRIAVVACGLACATFLAARTPGVVVFAFRQTIAAPAAARPSVPAIAPQPAIPAARTMRVAVSVTDPMNRFVAGLDADAFHIFENGVERKIVGVGLQKQPLSVGIVWDEKSGLKDLRNRLSELHATYTPSHPEVRTLEAQIADIENRAIPSIAVPGSHVWVTEIGENQSLSEALQSTRDQLRGALANQAAMVLVLGSSTWPGQMAVVNAEGYPVYAVGIDSRPDSPLGALPMLISGDEGVVRYPTLAPDQVSASLAALITQLVNQYAIEYVPGAAAETGRHAAVEVRLTPRAGLPQLTPHVSGR